MEKNILPIGKAYEPDEGARNPMVKVMLGTYCLLRNLLASLTLKNLGRYR